MVILTESTVPAFNKSLSSLALLYKPKVMTVAINYLLRELKLRTLCHMIGKAIGTYQIIGVHHGVRRLTIWSKQGGFGAFKASCSPV